MSSFYDLLIGQNFPLKLGLFLRIKDGAWNFREKLQNYQIPPRASANAPPPEKNFLAPPNYRGPNISPMLRVNFFPIFVAWLDLKFSSQVSDIFFCFGGGICLALESEKVIISLPCRSNSVKRSAAMASMEAPKEKKDREGWNNAMESRLKNRKNSSWQFRPTSYSRAYLIYIGINILLNPHCGQGDETTIGRGCRKKTERRKMEKMNERMKTIENILKSSPQYCPN